MADDKERFRRALDFMKMLGISHTVVAPILRRLIKLYDNEWSLIEEENYRALADSYFEHVENKEAKTSQRVTRNMARRVTPNAEQTGQREGKAKYKEEEEYRERRIEHKEDRKNEQVADADCTSAMERKLDTMKYEKEFPAGVETDHIMESGSSHEATTSNGFSGALCFNTQVECVRYEEKKSTESRQIGKKRQTSASPVRVRSERSFTSSSVSVKEEPVEMTSRAQKGQSVCQGILPTVPNKSLCVEKTTMEIVPLKEVSHSSGLGANSRREESKQNKGALSAIAALYGGLSDEEAGEEPPKVHRLVERKSNTSCPSRDVRKSKTPRTSRDRLALVWQQPQQLAVASEQPQQLALVSEQPHRSGGDDNESYRHSSDDISRGQELVPIRLVNDLTQDSLPLTFYYIPKNITFQSAYINFSLDRIGEEDCCGNCFGDCLKRYPPCHCARETGGEFAYNSEGLLRVPFLQEAIADKRSGETTNHMYYCKNGACPLEQGDNREPCKGHLMRKFVKECWIKCGCSMLCGNRVVQKGIRCKLQVFFTSKKKGWGVRTLEDLPAGAFVCEYVGEILTNIELDMRNTAREGHSDHYPVLLDADWSSENILRDDELLCLDATNYGNVARFINHRCEDANLVDIPVEIESPDHHYYHIAFFTTRLVKAYEELTWDYCIDFDDATHPIKAFQCACESKYCRGRS